MYKARKIPVAAASLCLVTWLCWNCSHEDPRAVPTGSNIVEVHIGARMSPVYDSEAKITLEDGITPSWEGNEVMELLVGDESSVSSGTGLQVSVPQTSPGVFSGTVDLGKYTIDDIHFVTVSSTDTYISGNASSQWYFRWNHASVQNQAQAGVFGDNIGLYASVSGAQLSDGKGGINIDNLSLNWSHSLLKLNVYGTHPWMDEDEILRSVTLTVGDGNRLVYDMEIAGDGPVRNLSDAGNSLTVNLQEECTVAGRDSGNGIMLWAAVSAAAGTSFSSEVTGVTVVTDKATYSKDVSWSYSRTPGGLCKLGINLVNGYARSSENPTVTDVPAAQSKYYMSAARDLEGKVVKGTAGMRVMLQDSKFYATGERILYVKYTSGEDISGTLVDGELTGGSKSVTLTWASDDPVSRPAVLHAPDAAEFGLLCLPGSHSGTFEVKTSRYTYEFTRDVTLAERGVTDVVLDFASPDVQPVRKVGIIGDSISTFEDAVVSTEYALYYPMNDPNVGVNPDIAVDSKEKTYWWRLIYDYMQHGTLDVNSSWSGAKVIHEMKTSRSGKSMAGGFVDRAYDFVDPDIIIIHGGTNDSNNDIALGTYDWDYPIGQLDVLKYRSAYIQLVKMLQARYEGVHIIILVGDRLKEEYAETNRQVAAHFGLPCVDFVGDTIEKCKGSHPTAPAFDFMASKIYQTCIDYLP